jgi:hypothetical protein
MRGPRRIGLLAISAVCVFACTAASAYAVEDDQLFNTSVAGGTALRDINTLPPTPGGAFPDSLEFKNVGNVVFKAGTVLTNTCSEIEFAGFVTKNEVGGEEKIPELSLPWGVAENDECTPAHVYFGPVNAAGALETHIAIDDDNNPNPIDAVVTRLSFTFLEVPGLGAGEYCTYGVVAAEKLVGAVTSPVAGLGYGEEGAEPNLKMDFAGQKAKKQPGSAALCPAELELTAAKFILETPSTTTDGAFYKT